MAIVLDSSAVSTDQTASPLTWTHTVGTGASRLLVVGIATNATTTDCTVSAVTFGGVPMLVTTNNGVAGATDRVKTYVYTLAAPAQGAGLISVTFSGGTSPHACGGSVSYFGAQQNNNSLFNNADNTSSSNGTSSGDTASSITPRADRCWVFTIGVQTANTSPTMTPNQTQRATQTLGNAQPGVMIIQDTNGPVSPIGSSNCGFVVGGTGVNGWCVQAESFAEGQYSGQDFGNSQQFIQVGGGMSRNERAT